MLYHPLNKTTKTHHNNKQQKRPTKTTPPPQPHKIIKQQNKNIKPTTKHIKTNILNIDNIINLKQFFIKCYKKYIMTTPQPHKHNNTQTYTPKNTHTQQNINK